MLLALAEVLGPAAANISGRSGSFLEDAAGSGSGRDGPGSREQSRAALPPSPAGAGTRGEAGGVEGLVASVCGSPRPLPQSPSPVPSLQPLNLQTFGGFHPLASRKRQEGDRSLEGEEEVAVAGGGESATLQTLGARGNSY